MLGTFVEVGAEGAPQSVMSAAIDAAFTAAAEVHRLMSFHDAGSDVSRLNREAAVRPVAVHPWTYRVLQAADELNRRSAGAFDIAIAPILQALHLLPSTDASGLALQQPCGGGSIELLPECQVRFHRSIGIDLGGIAKGFAVDRAIEMLKDRGVPRGVVNAGGDLAVFGSDPGMIHIRDPRDIFRTLCRVEVQGEALASSSGTFDPVLQSGPSRPTVIDPRDQEPVTAIIGASVRAPSCMIADALTKLVIIAGESAAPMLDHYGASAMFVSATGEIHVTGSWREVMHLAA